MFVDPDTLCETDRNEAAATTASGETKKPGKSKDNLPTNIHKQAKMVRAIRRAECAEMEAKKKAERKPGDVTWGEARFTIARIKKAYSGLRIDKAIKPEVFETKCMDFLNALVAELTRQSGKAWTPVRVQYYLPDSAVLVGSAKAAYEELVNWLKTFPAIAAVLNGK